ncbi:MAG: asparaginase [Bacteroidales bacterium]|nr:asparaginase [Bacteroidales bacterium]
MGVLLIYTGGTVGMARDPKTGTLSPIDFKNIEQHLPVLNNFTFTIDYISFSPLQDSSNFNPNSWIKIARTIEENYDKYDGFVVLHGTDTMAYTASALSYMLGNIAKPVILTGAQLPVGLVRTDGRENIITSIELAAAKENGESIIQEVCIYFNNKLTRGNRTTKISTEHFSAYISPNYPTLVDVGLHLKYNYNAIRHQHTDAELTVNTYFDDNVAILKLFPGINKNYVNAVLETKDVKAVIMETFGAGNGPTDSWFINRLKQYIDGGGILLNITQCNGGVVEMGQYETSREMKAIGVIGGKDLIFEAAVTKLMFLLGNHDSREEIIKRITEPIAGEIS